MIGELFTSQLQMLRPKQLKLIERKTQIHRTDANVDLAFYV